MSITVYPQQGKVQRVIKTRGKGEGEEKEKGLKDELNIK